MTEAAKRVHVPVAQRRAQLVEAAMTVMLRDGAWGLTTRAVAAQAEVSLGALHYAFDSKADLIGAVFAADVDSAAAVVSEAMDAGGSPETMLRRALRSYAEALRKAPTAELVLQELTLMGVRDDALRVLVSQAVKDFRAEIARFLAHVGGAAGAGVASGANDARVPIAVLAESFFAQLVGLAQNWLSTGDDALLDACLDDLAVQMAARLAT